MAHRILLQNARLADGSGAPLIDGDVLIEENSISLIGPRPTRTQGPTNYMNSATAFCSVMTSGAGPLPLNTCSPSINDPDLSPSPR